jgi:two-component system phosphate regulon sensor histidine kinase PhoR
MEDEDSMENHASRPEVVEAFANGEGKDIRRSSTSSYQTFYYARRMEDGSVLRLGKESWGMYRLFFNMIWVSAIIGCVIFVMCAVFSKRLTRRIVAPVERLSQNLLMAEDESVYDEIQPFVATIKQQHVDILENARMRQEFTANVSHELRTPLTVISGYAEMIANGMAAEEDVRRFAEEIHQNAERLQTLIGDTIRLSELDDENLKLEFEQVNLYELAEHVVAAAAIAAEKQEITLELIGEVVWFTASRMLIEELIYNLCSNAIRYNQRGGKVVVTVAREEGHPVLSVADTGIGIPPELQERVFERFYCVDESHSKRTGGTGLGLAIVKHIAVQHDAQITLKSEVGVGTEVKVIF